jgi:hypothetical protein
MPLDDACKRYENRLVFVLPVQGFGWCRIDPRSPSSLPGEEKGPAPFHATVVEFCYYLEKIRAGIGVIHEPNHPCDGQWLAFCVRDANGEIVYDFTTSPGKHNIRIGRTRPTVNIDPDNLPIPEWMQFSAPPVLSGFGYIAESGEFIKDLRDAVMAYHSPPHQ